MSKTIEFDQDEVALCPNGHGRMRMVAWNAGYAQRVPEARAFCAHCRHTMIVADERPLIFGSTAR